MLMPIKTLFVTSAMNVPIPPPGTMSTIAGCTLIEDNIRIEAEDYSRFHDMSSGNLGGAYRQDDVDIEASL